MNELIVKEFNEIITKEDIETLKAIDELEKRAKVIKDAIKKKGIEFLERNNLTEEGYQQDGIKLTYKKGYKKNIVDTDAMKEQGIYEDFVKETSVSPSVSVSVVYEE